MKQHKWHKEIKAWADGAEIEWTFRGLCEWHTDTRPDWADGRCDFRIKQQSLEVVASGQPFRFKEKTYLYAYIDTRFGKIEFSTEWDKTSAMPLIGKIEVQDD